MKRARFIFAIATVLMLCSRTEGFINVIKNGSFEEQGYVWPPMSPQNCPLDWNDVNLPTSKFSGWVSTEWSSDEDYSLTLLFARRE